MTIVFVIAGVLAYVFLYGIAVEAMWRFIQWAVEYADADDYDNCRMYCLIWPVSIPALIIFFGCVALISFVSNLGEVIAEEFFDSHEDEIE